MSTRMHNTWLVVPSAARDLLSSLHAANSKSLVFGSG